MPHPSAKDLFMHFFDTFSIRVKCDVVQPRKAVLDSRPSLPSKPPQSLRSLRSESKLKTAKLGLFDRLTLLLMGLLRIFSASRTINWSRWSDSTSSRGPLWGQSVEERRSSTLSGTLSGLPLHPLRSSLLRIEWLVEIQKFSRRDPFVETHRSTRRYEHPSSSPWLPSTIETVQRHECYWRRISNSQIAQIISYPTDHAWIEHIVCIIVFPCNITVSFESCFFQVNKCDMLFIDRSEQCQTCLTMLLQGIIEHF